MAVLEVLWMIAACVVAQSDTPQQAPLLAIAAATDHDSNQSSHRADYGLPIHVNRDIGGWPWYYTMIGIGSEPVQTVKAIIDLQAINLWVVSEHCNTSMCQLNAQYNSSLSKSYRSSDVEAYMMTAMSGLVNGTVATESISLDSRANATSHQVVEVTSWLPGRVFATTWAAGLGLSPGKGHFYRSPSTLYPVLPNILDRITRDSSGDSQVTTFSLLLPKDEINVGDLSFGVIHPDLFEGDLISHALHPPNATGWQIAGPEIAVRARNGTVLQTFDLTDHTAYLDTEAAGYIVLPEDVTAGVLRIVQPEQVRRDWECERFGLLPDIVFRFDGQDIVLGPYDYLREEAWPFAGVTWEPIFSTPSETAFLLDGISNETLLLGGGFLRAVYSVFDWEQRTVSFARRRAETDDCETQDGPRLI